MNTVYLAIPRVVMICIMLLPGKAIKIMVIFYSLYDRPFEMLITSCTKQQLQLFEIAYFTSFFAAAGQ